MSPSTSLDPFSASTVFAGEPDPNHSSFLFGTFLLGAVLFFEASFAFVRFFGGSQSKKLVIFVRYRRGPNFTAISSPSAKLRLSPKTCFMLTRFTVPLSFKSNHSTAISFLLRAIRFFSDSQNHQVTRTCEVLMSASVRGRPRTKHVWHAFRWLSNCNQPCTVCVCSCTYVQHECVWMCTCVIVGECCWLYSTEDLSPELKNESEHGHRRNELAIVWC